jgi:hypothetical protein
VRTFNSGVTESILQGIMRNLSFTTEHNGFYAYDGGRQRLGLEEILQGTIPEYCSIQVTKVTKLDENGETTYGPPLLCMVCGEPEILEGHGVVSPRFLMLADEAAENVTVEFEMQCRWKIKDPEE